MKIALANLPYPSTLDDGVARVTAAVADAARAGAAIVCFPECYLPGYRGLGHAPPPPDMQLLECAWTAVAAAAGAARIAVVLGTERVVDGGLRPTALVIDEGGRRLGFQDKAQLDPSEDATYARGAVERPLFEAAGLTFGVVICHEGWRYPETVRALARRGARLVFHPHYHPHEEGAFRPTTFGDPRNSFHEKAILCRAAENTVYVASVNYAAPGSGTTSAVARPDGTLMAHQPYGEAGLLVVDLDPALATGLLASRCRY